MNTSRIHQMRIRHTAGHPRGGAALIVVISLLGMLAFLGYVFYTFASQQRASAEFFARVETAGVSQSPDVFWDWSLKQIIIGTDADLTNSALYGSGYAMVPNMIGRPNVDASTAGFGAEAGDLDLTWGFRNPALASGPDPYLPARTGADIQLYDGAGITTVVGALNSGLSPQEFGFDINQDGVFDPTSEPTWENFVMNFSPAADVPPAAYPSGVPVFNPGGIYSANGTAFSGIPEYAAYEPDAGYTYPDINSLFLGYDATVRGWQGGAPGAPRDYRVIIPSYFRPQLFPTLRGTNGDPAGVAGTGFADLYVDPETARMVLRPHVYHITHDPVSGVLSRRYVPPPLPQFIGELTADADGDGNMDSVQAQSGDTNRIIAPFPFFVDPDNNGVPQEFGVWTSPNRARVDGQVKYEFDIDADGDGVRDAIWLDLDHPMVTLADGRQFVPIFGVKIIDADALLNVNAHGNTHGLYVRRQDGSIEVLGPDGKPIAGSAGGVYNEDGLAELILFHQSNLGQSPSEVNLSLALTADLRDPDPATSPVDPRAAEPETVLDVDDVIATQFDMAWNYHYNPGSYPGGAGVGPTMPGGGAAYTAAEMHAPGARAIANMEAQQIINGRRNFDQLRDGRVRENPNQILGRHGDRIKIGELYRRLAFGITGTPDGLSDGEPLPGPLAGGFNLDDDGDSNQLGLAPFFGGPGDDDFNAPGVTTSNFRRGGGSYYYDQRLFGVQIPPAVHPLDVLGTGSGIYDRDSASGGYLRRQLDGGPLANNPSVFPTYLDPVGIAAESAGTGFPLNYWHYNGIATDDSEPDLTGVAPWRLGLGGGALDVNDPQYDFLIDEPNEVILEQDFRNPEYDAVYPTQEMDGLHLSRSDFQAVSPPSRLREVASINLDRIREEFRAQIAGRLTTDSWDRLEPGQTRFDPADSIPGSFREWEYNIWTGTGVDFATAEETFPPQFGAAATPVPAGSAEDPIRPELRLLLKNERLFSGGMTGAVPYPRHRLNINRILSGDSAAPAGIDPRAFDDDGNPQFRQLTPHPVFEVGGTQVTVPPVLHAHVTPGEEHLHASVNDPDVAFVNLDVATAGTVEVQKKAQEWWARYDRQRMARDIYTLLYTLGWGVDTFNPLEEVPDADSARLMAQFAVNYVDALDRDNVITKFEYDPDLSDGWQWTSGGEYVNGVEAQQLTFSEVVWTRTSDAGEDFTRTAWDDDDGHHQFLHVELRSVSPFDVELGNDMWRIVRTDPHDPNTPGSGMEQQARVTFKPNSNDPATRQSLTVRAGRNFTIGASDKDAHPGSPLVNADFYVDHDGDGNWESIVPEGTSTVPDPTDELTVNPRTDLDLVSSQQKPPLDGVTYSNYSEYFTLDAGTTGTGQLINLVGLNDPLLDDSATAEFDLVLQRRRHLDAEGQLNLASDPAPIDGRRLDEPASSDWIEVDRIRVRANEFQPNDDADVPVRLEQIVAQFRHEPLSSPVDPTSQPTTSGGDVVNHTIADLWDAAGTDENPDRHRDNVQDPPINPAEPITPFTLWQPHFDRDYSSIFELLSVPLFGPEQLTRRLANAETPAAPKLTGDYYDSTTGETFPSLAGRLFMNTDPFGTPTDDTDDNRWYRVLEYLEVPGRAEEAIRHRLTKLVRTPGKINLNTIRHEQVLAGLIDDLFIQRFNALGPERMTDSDVSLEDPSVSGVRNWMDELRLARDGIDPVNYFAAGGKTFLPLPGIPGVVGDPGDTSTEYGPTAGRPQFGALPFRPFSYASPLTTHNVTTGTGTAVDSPVPPTAHTILRDHLAGIGDQTAVERINRTDGLEDLSLFEARPTGDVGTDTFDYHTRNRLLAKIANNSTQRSNVFLCWIVVEYFEAHQPEPDTAPQVVQVGARLEGSPTHRGFFVIDRSRLERAVDEDAFLGTNPGNGREDTFRFNWRDFVIHRRTIQ